MKVYGITVYCTDSTGSRDQHRAFVATDSKRAAAAAVGVTRYEFDKYGSATGNAIEEAIALSSPGTAFVIDGDSSRIAHPDLIHPARIERSTLTATPEGDPDDPARP